MTQAIIEGKPFKELVNTNKKQNFDNDYRTKKQIKQKFRIEKTPCYQDMRPACGIISISVFI